MNEQSFIIRIYRYAHCGGAVRRADDAVTLAGIVESPVGDKHQAFHDIEELWAILAGHAMAEAGTKHASKHRGKR